MDPSNYRPSTIYVRLPTNCHCTIVLLCDPPCNEYDDQWRTDHKVTLDDERVFSVYPIILLGDFGISVPLRDAHTVALGTVGYAAPVH